MARTAFTVQTMTGPYPSNFLMDTLTFAAADTVNQNSFVYTGREIIIVENTDASTRNVTLTSIADDLKRVGNVTKAVTANAFTVFKASELTGWIQSTGLFHLEGDHAGLLFAVIRY